MRGLLFALMMLLCVPASAEVVKVTTSVQVSSAQADAECMAREGRMRHCGRNGGRREGVGFSTTGPDQAIRACCFWGKYRAREVGVARGPRGWYACVRYE